jgi:hypothetical protein
MFASGKWSEVPKEACFSRKWTQGYGETMVLWGKWAHVLKEPLGVNGYLSFIGCKFFFQVFIQYATYHPYNANVFISTFHPYYATFFSILSLSNVA